MIHTICLWLCRTFRSRYRVIPHAEDGNIPLLDQFLLFKTRRTSYYLQHFVTPESTKWCHRHRWFEMRSFVLSGWFVEHRPGDDRYIRHNAGTTYKMDWQVIHRVVYWSKDCWTLFICTDPSDEWGYYPVDRVEPAAFVHWRQHVQKKIPNLERGELS